MSASIAVAVRKMRKPPLRLSPLLRFAIATARPDVPALLPTKIPRKCVGKLFHCTNVLRWEISDGVNTVYICSSCAEIYWENHDVMDHHIERIV